jgi:hypothetical protein
MNDRELLKRAAKAADIKIDQDWYAHPSGREGYPLTGMGAAVWNPLEDDGDALRLAVDLAIYPTQVGLTVEVYLHRPPEIFSWHHVEPHNGDPYAATRRAIVRAAAALAG